MNESFATIFVMGLGLIAFIIINAQMRTKRYKSITIKCPRCGHESTRDRFYPAANQLIGLLLLCAFILPGLIYFMWGAGKVICPNCDNRF